MELTKATWVLLYSPMTTSQGWWMLETLCSSTFHLRMPHRCSVGFRSGDMLGQSGLQWSSWRCVWVSYHFGKMPCLSTKEAKRFFILFYTTCNTTSCELQSPIHHESWRQKWLHETTTIINQICPGNMKLHGQYYINVTLCNTYMLYDDEIRGMEFLAATAAATTETRC